MVNQARVLVKAMLNAQRSTLNGRDSDAVSEWPSRRRRYRWPSVARTDTAEFADIDADGARVW
jgi:hypothetical protein